MIIVQVLVASEARMLGLDTGNPEADAEAEMWIAGLLGKYQIHINIKTVSYVCYFSVGTLAAAIPVALLNPSLGFRKRRSLHKDSIVNDNVAEFLSKYRIN